jgi:phosphonate degradation associated HDIG domain protein
MNPALATSELIDLFRQRGHLHYEGEGVSQLQHGWQCALLAKRANASPALQLAAWLHDIGHLATGWVGTPTLQSLDDAHQVLGARILLPLFGEAVAAPVRLHVDAKRYLVSINPDYLQRLSDDSIRSLQLQGGPLSDDEAAQFAALPHADSAIRLRAWDDAAKQTELMPSDPETALAGVKDLIDTLLLPGRS